MANVIHWFEIPSKNFDRACTFYGKIMEWEIQKINHENGIKYGFLPIGTQDEVGGAIVHGEGFTPSSKGSLIYLNAGADLSIALSKVEKAGGKILKPKTSIGENGYMAQFIDTEGNRMALHSMR